ncbi:hypothetical protein DY000_02046018 [Brassica cretica]|uniref:Uncharacterized protein n=1 Tax=Brassica cretica TaxID=69181 RepID=A0ABQ7F5T3_BRACR|nr:hypothetical protein DY000_02046018 [Brassica cretica]
MDRVLPGDCREDGTGENQWMPFHAYLREDEQHWECVSSFPVFGCSFLVSGSMLCSEKAGQGLWFSESDHAQVSLLRFVIRIACLGVFMCLNTTSQL